MNIILLSQIKGMTIYESIFIIISGISLGFVFIGGCFAAIQWVKGLTYKRNEIVKPLIDNVRSNETIAMVMNMIDWNTHFWYDGGFHIICDDQNHPLSKYTDEDLFKMMDETLSVFSYICYLRKTRSLKQVDMSLFEYEIRRLFDNIHICNYLYSLHHWSEYLGVNMSFSHIVKYALKKKFIDRSFLKLDSKVYTCFLVFGKE